MRVKFLMRVRFCHRNYLLPIIRIYYIIREQRKTFRGAYVNCRSCSVSNSFEFQQVQSIDMKEKQQKTTQWSSGQTNPEKNKQMHISS